MNSKRCRAESLEASCQWALLNVQITTLLFTFTVQKYIYPSVIISMTILKVQVNGQTGQSRTKKLCFKLCLSSMSFLCTIHVKSSILTKINAVICGKNDVIGQNNVKLCDFFGKTISQLLEGLEPFFLGGYGHK